MAAITSAQSGLWSAASTWVGGVVPGIADTVTIAATHVVTVDGNYTTGGDTGGGFVVRGTLKASRTVNSSLAIRANVNVAQAGAGIDYGTNTDPIPQGVTAELILNASATPASNKYQIQQTVNGVFFRFCGAPKTRNAFLTAPVSAGATSIQVTNASGWVVGDSLFLEQPTTDVAQVQTVTITSISGTTIGVSAITLARVSGLAVSNLNCNVLIRSQVDTAVSTHYLQVSSATAPSGLVEVRNCEIRNIGYLYLNWSSGNTVPPANPATFDSCYLNSNAAANSMIGSTFGSLGMPFQNNILVGGLNYTQQNLIQPNNSSLYALNCVFYNLSSNSFSGALGYNGLSELVLTNCRVNSYVNCLTIANANSHIYTNCRFRSKTTELFSTTLCNIQTIDCDFATPTGVRYLKSYGNSGGLFSMQNPVVDSADKTNPNATYGAMKNPVYGINGAFTANRFYTYNTFALNQNTVVNRATNNIALKLNNSQTSGSYSFTFQGITGVSQRIVGYLRHDTTYGTSNPPSISFSGAGVSGSFTSSSTVNLWEKFDVTLTPTSVGTITATVTFAGATNGTAYLDGVYQFPFITENWIYGFQKLAQVNSVEDANITLSEAAVASLASVVTLDDVYDSATYWSVTNFTSVGYTIPFIANGTQINFGSNTVAINNGAASNFAYSGTTATIKASALTSGTKFKSLAAGEFKMNTPVNNTTLIGNVSQDTPTNLTGVTIIGNLTYNTNTPITVTFTDCEVSGTISNSGSGLVKIVKAGTTPWLTTGSNVSSIATVVVETPAGLALSTYIVKNGSTDLGWVVATNNRTLEISETDTFAIFAIAYGYKAKIVNASALDLSSFKFELLPETYIDTSLSATTRNFIASKFSVALDAYNRIALSLDTDLRSYTPPEVMNAVQYFISSGGGALIAAGVLYGGSIDGVEITQGGLSIGTPGFYGKVNDSVTSTTDLGILVPISIDVLPSVYAADPTYTPVKKNTSGIVLQYAPWTKMTADISAVDKSDIRSGLALENTSAAIKRNTDLIPACL